MVNALDSLAFPAIGERIGAVCSGEEDALLLTMLGQEYVIRHNGITLRGQQAPDSHASVIVDYLFSQGAELTRTPWRAAGDFLGGRYPDFRKNVELMVAQHASEVIARAQTMLPMLDGKAVPSLIGGDMAIAVRALPKVYLHVELAQETQDFPPEAWILFSNNADAFLSAESRHILAEILKDRLLSLLRIY